ncbi:MAG TPA: hypothetical protein VFC31_15385 [Candidatus Limnocylindria bacterium]|nr:hypothetical protein [Candidatus Limnocylindria bacterium]
MTRVGRRARLLAFGGLALVFALALVLLRPVAAPLSDADYVAIAKDTPQGKLYFRSHTAPCSVTRVWNVQVNCDYVAAPGTPTEKFRVYIDPRTNGVVDVDMRFDP